MDGVFYHVAIAEIDLGTLITRVDAAKALGFAGSALRREPIHLHVPCFTRSDAAITGKAAATRWSPV